MTGADPAFCSGDDVKQMMAGAGDQVATGLHAAPRLTPAADALLDTDVPVIAAVNGAAVGWGMELALMADIRVASANARFGELFVKRGLCCDVAGLGRLAQLVGREHAAELLFTGRVIDADEAASMRPRVPGRVARGATAHHAAPGGGDRRRTRRSRCSASSVGCARRSIRTGRTWARG